MPNRTYLDTARFRFIADALHGDGGFRPSVSRDGTALSGPSHLVQYPRESDEKFARRNQVAWYANDLASACARFAGYLSQRRPQRLLDNPLLDAMADDCDWAGNSLDLFWGAFAVEAKARGAMLLLVDMPREPGATRADQLAERAVPYLTRIDPERVNAIELDERGAVAWIEIDDGDTLCGWDTEIWWRRKGDRITEEGAHGLGVCPVLAFAEHEFPRFGEFAQIADLARRLFNLHSELDEILRSQTFSLLTYQVPPDQGYAFDAAAVAAQIGTHNMLVHSGDTPAFIAPPDGPATIYLARIAALEEKIRRIGHQIEAPDRTESGVALKIRFQQLNSALSHWAGRMEDLERRVWDLACLWLGIENRTQVGWDDDYALTDIATELDALAAMQMTGFSEAVLRAKRQQIVALDFASSEDDEMAALLAAEEEGAHERAPVAQDEQAA